MARFPDSRYQLKCLPVPLWDTGNSALGLADPGGSQSRLDKSNINVSNGLQPFISVYSASQHFDRVAIYCPRVEQIDYATSKTPPPIILQIKMGADYITDAVALVQYTADKFGDTETTGFIVQIAPRLSNQIDIYARVDPQAANAQAINLRLRMMIDYTACCGSIVTQLGTGVVVPP